jgi:hypothetical protein
MLLGCWGATGNKADKIPALMQLLFSKEETNVNYDT